jgi:hypothetical protein
VPDTDGKNRPGLLVKWLTYIFKILEVNHMGIQSRHPN